MVSKCQVFKVLIFPEPSRHSQPKKACSKITITGTVFRHVWTKAVTVIALPRDFCFHARKHRENTTNGHQTIRPQLGIARECIPPQISPEAKAIGNGFLVKSFSIPKIGHIKRVSNQGETIKPPKTISHGDSPCIGRFLPEVPRITDDSVTIAESARLGMRAISHARQM